MPTHFKGNATQVLALDTFIKFARAHDTLGQNLDRFTGLESLTPTQFGALEALYHLGPSTPKVLNEKLLTSKANMTTVLENLEKQGYVRREKSKTDGRSVTIHLSPEGRKIIRRVFPKHAVQISDVFGVLTLAEQKQLGKLCKKLGLGLAHRKEPS